MIKIIFICHGNICRSVAAEYLFKYLIKKHNREKEFEVISRAVSDEEYMNDIYPPMKRVLVEHGIPISKHSALRISDNEYQSADLVLIMDSSNLRFLQRRFKDLSKVKFLGDYISQGYEIEDPWYTRDFEKAYSDIYSSCENFLMSVKIK